MVNDLKTCVTGSPHIIYGRIGCVVMNTQVCVARIEDVNKAWYSLLNSPLTLECLFLTISNPPAIFPVCFFDPFFL